MNVIVADNSETILQSKIETIMGQTNYTETEATQLLIENGNDEMMIIRKYLGITDTVTIGEENTKSKSKNQLIYQEIRTFMDGCSKTKINELGGPGPGPGPET
jgi:hypothetical protein